MSNREKFIIGLTVAVLIFGVTSLFGPDSGKKGQKGAENQQESAEELQASLETINAMVDSSEPTDVDSYVVSSVLDSRVSDPFYVRTKSEEKEEKAETPEIEIAYTGYMEAGKRRLAVLNGIEYEEGEGLLMGGFRLKRATPEWVEIESLNRDIVLRIPFEEEGL